MSIPVRMTVTGHYAGPVSRGAAAVLDVIVVTGAYTLGVSALTLMSKTFFGDRFDFTKGSPLWGVVLATWAFAYCYVSLAVAGRTVGKGVVGLRVVSAQGSAISGRAAFVRTLVLPLSIFSLGLGLVGILLGREHRAWHDQAARTCVVYDWGARSAQIPGPLSDFLTRHEATSLGVPPPPP